MPPCESTSSIHRRPKRSKASILAGSMTYSTTQVIMLQASGVRFRRRPGTAAARDLRGDEQDADRGEREPDPLHPAQPLAEHHSGQQDGDPGVERGQDDG